MKSVILKVFGVTPEQYAGLASFSANSIVRYRKKSDGLTYSENRAHRLVTLKKPKEGGIGEDGVPTLNLEIEVSVITP